MSTLTAPYPPSEDAPDLVAVTGADGFIGSHLVERLVERGHRVRALALYNSFGTYGWLDTLPADMLENVEVVMGDVRDQGSVEQLVAGTSTVYHLAALDRDPLLLRGPTLVYRHERHRHAQRARGGTSVRPGPRGPHLDERDVRDCTHRADRRVPPAADSVPIRG